MKKYNLVCIGCDEDGMIDVDVFDFDNVSELDEKKKKFVGWMFGFGSMESRNIDLDEGLDNVKEYSVRGLEEGDGVYELCIKEFNKELEKFKGVVGDRVGEVIGWSLEYDVSVFVMLNGSRVELMEELEKVLVDMSCNWY